MIKIFGNRVAIKEEKPSNVTNSGLYLPANVQNNQTVIGTVVAVGRGSLHNGEYIPVEPAVGDKVIANKYPCTEIKDNDETYIVVSENDVIAKL